MRVPLAMRERTLRRWLWKAASRTSRQIMPPRSDLYFIYLFIYLFYKYDVPISAVIKYHVTVESFFIRRQRSLGTQLTSYVIVEGNLSFYLNLS